MKDADAPAILCTVDVVLLTLQQGRLQAALLRRDRAPFAGALALPGGYIHAQEDVDAHASAARVLRDKAGLQSPYLEQLATFSGPVRDPRGWSVAVAYCALVPPDVLLPAQDRISLVDVNALPPLPFDHRQIIDTALQRVRSKSQYSSLPVHLCAEPFTLPQLQAVYEAVLGEPINKVSFRRKVDELAMLEAVPGALQMGGAHRPAQLYRVRGAYRHALSLSARGL
ncbi:MAG: NUDIX hydrolase [Gammaproteobacteria bacterium]|jgi:8-oxo-dGTP diphosphatase|nr:NUDIX hydrolase [Gammaproteobacteria bacterium]MBU0830236.1 NUDIX hydrolase [Gammaproteobacteria bacterium]MBU0892567.1 NUDIX hydrolase [Gammaproteobacteria bacterium]MBU1353192.1 NUDIX hydrolase [Gammaproteobacteria bacterium]MBU1507693.1 NUDIX hydrolase [Gammaproteobacteria bacterium]